MDDKTKKALANVIAHLPVFGNNKLDRDDVLEAVENFVEPRYCKHCGIAEDVHCTGFEP